MSEQEGIVSRGDPVQSVPTTPEEIAQNVQPSGSPEPPPPNQPSEGGTERTPQTPEEEQPSGDNMSPAEEEETYLEED